MKFAEIIIHRLIGFRKHILIKIDNDMNEDKMDRFITNLFDCDGKYIEFHPIGKKPFVLNKKYIAAIEYTILDLDMDLVFNNALDKIIKK